MMRIEQIKYFLTILSAGSITNAAQQLFITQQALSDSLKKLEKELGIVLFERAKTGVTVTEDGHLFAIHAAEIIAHYNDLEWAFAQRHCIPNKAEVIAGKITVYTMPLLTATFFPDILQQVSHTYPELEIQCIEATATDTIKALSRREADIGLLLLNAQRSDAFFQLLDESVSIRELKFDQVVACVPTSSPLAQREYINREEFNKTVRISFGLNDPLFSKAALGNIIMYSTNPIAHERLIINNTGISSAPRLLYDKLFSSEAVCPLPIVPAISVSQYLLLPRQETYSPAIKVVIKLLVEGIRKLKQDVSA